MKKIYFISFLILLNFNFAYADNVKEIKFKKKAINVKEKWENKSCAVKRPFDYKWEVKIPTVILYFDNVYVGDELVNKITLENYN